MNKKTLWLTRTAMLIALLLVLQSVTKGAGQYVTGSCVNAVLAVAALVSGIQSAAVVALVSPFAAFLLGIGPQLLPIVPAIALGNLVYVVVLWVILRKHKLMSARGGGCKTALQCTDVEASADQHLYGDVFLASAGDGAGRRRCGSVDRGGTASCSQCRMGLNLQQELRGSIKRERR